MLAPRGWDGGPGGSPQVGACIQVGALSIDMDLPARATQLVDEVSRLYAGYPRTQADDLADLRISLVHPGMWARYVSGEVQARVDGMAMSEPMSARLGVPLLESTLNWYIGTNVLAYLLIHAGVVERGGLAMVFPGVSGSGKSTLSTVLGSSGWRLLSDEIAMIRPEDAMVAPHPRPITLKNASIDIVRARIGQERFLGLYEGTPKGTVAFVRPPDEAIARAGEAARPAAIVFPRFEPDTPASLSPLGRAEAFRMLIDHTPNYATLMARGFASMAALVEMCQLYSLRYGDVGEAVAVLDALDLSPAAAAG